MKVVVAAFNQEKALVGAFSVIVQLHRLIVYSTLGHILHSGRDGAGGDQDVPHRPRPLPQVRRGHDQPRPGDRAALLELLENRLQVENHVTLPAPMIVVVGRVPKDK